MILPMSFSLPLNLRFQHQIRATFGYFLHFRASLQCTYLTPSSTVTRFSVSADSFASLHRGENVLVQELVTHRNAADSYSVCLLP